MESGNIKPINRRYKGVIKIKLIICSLLALLLALSNGYCTWPPAYASEPGKREAATVNNSAGVGSEAAVNLAHDEAQPRLGKAVNCKYSVTVRSGPGTRYKKIGTAPKGAVYAVTGMKGSWYRIIYGGRAGYTPVKYFSVYYGNQEVIIEGYYASWAAYDGYGP